MLCWSLTAEWYGVSAQYRLQGGPGRPRAIPGSWFQQYWIVLEPGSEGLQGIAGLHRSRVPEVPNVLSSTGFEASQRTGLYGRLVF